jgi:glycosyltransferase involved in cell wall biosynthesis
MTLSLCLIVRDVEEHLGTCLASVEKYVDEIIIVDTGSKDGTRAIAQAHGAKVYDFTPDTHPDGFMLDDEKTGAPPPYTGELFLADFSGARNLSFEKATKDYVFWIDSDDVVVGAENLPAILRDLEGQRLGSAWLRYDYSFSNGKPNCQLWRERIMRRGTAKWVNPIHEICLVSQDTVHKNYDSVTITHRRDELKTPRSMAHRNYKVLRRQYEQTKDKPDPRTLFYLGNETRFHSQDEAIGYYEKYLELSGWDEERAVARILLGQIHEAGGELEKAFKAYSSAALDFPANPDALFSLARIAYKKGNWVRCVQLTEQGFSLGDPVSPIMYNPLDRSYHPHTYYNVALNNLGRVADALKSCEDGLRAIPADHNLRFNHDLYSAYLEKNPQAKQAVTPKAIALAVTGNPIEGVPDLPHDATTAFAIYVWKEMLRHDEVVKAKDFLESLPYFMDDSPYVLEAKRKTEELYSKVATDEQIKAYYGTLHLVEEARPLQLGDIPKEWSQYPRWAFIKRHFEEKKGLRFIELGCQDGWICNRVAKMGHSGVAVDFSDGHLAIARRNAEAFNLDMTYVKGFISEVPKLISEKFDVVICTEVIEHYVDPQELLTVLQGLLKPGGDLLLSTPKGAWLQGQQGVWLGGTSYSHAWDAPREHIRAFSPSGLRKTLEEKFDVLSCFAWPMPKPDVPNQASLIAHCKKRTPSVPYDGPTGLQLDIIIWTGPAWEWWSPMSPYEEGTGGSELACVEMARRFAKQGHKVRVFSDCPNRDGLYDGVEYRHFGAMGDVECDVFISSRQPNVVLQRSVKAKAKFLWVHDIHVGADGSEMNSALLEFDRVLCLSNWHKQFFCQTYPWLDPSRVLVTRNGVNLDRFPYPERSRGNRLIYTSSANRGLGLLLELLPRIRQHVPDVELDIFYGFDVWKRAAAGNPAELEEIAQLESKVAATEGAHARGRASQQDLAKAWLKAKVWAYPTWFTETSCISAMEAQGSGCVPVTTALAALNETVASGILVEPPLDENYKNSFVNAVVKLLTDEPYRQKYVGAGREFAEGLSWDSLARDWEEMFFRVIEDAKVNPMHEFNSCA